MDIKRIGKENKITKVKGRHVANTIRKKNWPLRTTIVTTLIFYSTSDKHVHFIDFIS